jgi:Na+/H+ antiporter NhaD/arsenite permease-like protein
LFFSFPFIEVIFNLFHFSFRDFVVLVRRCFVRRFCATLFVFLVLFRYLFNSDCQINLDPVQIQSMTLASLTLQIRRHGYSGYLNIVICVGFCTLPFYAINIDVVSLFADSSFLFLANLHCIDVLYQFE